MTTSGCDPWVDNIPRELLALVAAESLVCTPQVSVKPVALQNVSAAESSMIDLIVGPSREQSAQTVIKNYCVQDLQSCRKENMRLSDWSHESMILIVMMLTMTFLSLWYANRQRALRDQVEMNRAFEKWEMRRAEVWNRKDKP
jgi:hypothetical protein